tara:strand:+ start:336 stop:752 length:417 start_codon:yes stop_codon:yes gene_type:complete
VEKVQKVFVVKLLLLQEQVAQVVVDKVTQVLNLVLQKLEQQEILLQQLLLKEILVEMEFILVVQQVLKLLVAVVEQVPLEQMQLNQVDQILMLVLVVLELLVVLQDHLSPMVVAVAVEKEQPLDVVLLEDQAVVVKVV